MHLHCDHEHDHKAPGLMSGGSCAAIDIIGIVVSSLCLVHCLVLPLLVLLLPTVPGLVHDDRTHVLLASFVVVFCLLGIIPGYRRHGHRFVLGLMLFGLSLVLFATFVAGHAFGETWEIPLITVGNLLVVAAHLKNRKLLAVRQSA